MGGIVSRQEFLYVKQKCQNSPLYGDIETVYPSDVELFERQKKEKDYWCNKYYEMLKYGYVYEDNKC